MLLRPLNYNTSIIAEFKLLVNRIVPVVGDSEVCGSQAFCAAFFVGKTMIASCPAAEAMTGCAVVCRCHCVAQTTFAGTEPWMVGVWVFATDWNDARQVHVMLAVQISVWRLPH